MGLPFNAGREPTVKPQATFGGEFGSEAPLPKGRSGFALPRTPPFVFVKLVAVRLYGLLSLKVFIIIGWKSGEPRGQGNAASSIWDGLHIYVCYDNPLKDTP